MSAQITVVFASLVFPLWLAVGVAQYQTLAQNARRRGSATRTKLVYPASVAVARDGSLYIAEAGAQRIWKVTPLGVISRLPERDSASERSTREVSSRHWLEAANRRERFMRCVRDEPRVAF
ncbi:MAG: hypothetical protein L0312_01705 [Acidobacteria bacterium]|nr:hypothetical protein [Acidobacteriota bacterium]